MLPGLEIDTKYYTTNTPRRVNYGNAISNIEKNGKSRTKPRRRVQSIFLVGGST